MHIYKYVQGVLVNNGRFYNQRKHENFKRNIKSASLKVMSIASYTFPHLSGNLWMPSQ